MGELLDLWWQGYVAVAISSAARKPADRSQGSRPAEPLRDGPAIHPEVLRHLTKDLLDGTLVS
jgi:hypothetical protein